MSTGCQQYLCSGVALARHAVQAVGGTAASDIGNQGGKMRRTFTRLLLTVCSLSVFAVSAHATVVDLTSAGSSGSANGALYIQVPDQSTGTGVIDPFLRIQANGTEQGYNTDAGTPFDTKAGIWTHNLLMSDLVTETIGGVSYFEFLLDVNQTSANPLLSLNNIQIFTSASAPGTSTDLTTLGTLRFNNDVGADGDTTVELNYGLNPGSGAGDMYLYVPTSFFAGASANDYVIFYSAFGTGNGSNDGFEEWALVTDGSTTVPDGGTTVGLLGMGMLGLGLLARRKNLSLR